MELSGKISKTPGSQIESICNWGSVLASVSLESNGHRNLRLMDALSDFSFMIDLRTEFFADDAELKCAPGSIVVLCTNTTSLLVVAFTTPLQANLTTRLPSAAVFDRRPLDDYAANTWGSKVVVTLYFKVATIAPEIWLIDTRGLHSVFVKIGKLGSTAQNFSVVASANSPLMHGSGNSFTFDLNLQARVDPQNLAVEHLLE